MHSTVQRANIGQLCALLLNGGSSVAVSTADCESARQGSIPAVRPFKYAVCTNSVQRQSAEGRSRKQKRQVSGANYHCCCATLQLYACPENPIAASGNDAIS